MTLSGGEPTLQYAFCRELLERAKSEGIHTCLDTCGHVASGRLLDLLPLVDLFHYDIKLFEADAHQQWTGVDGSLIRKNLQLLIDRGATIRLRCPIIPGVNDAAEHSCELDQWARHPGIEKVERLTYHTIGNAKYADLGMPVPAF